MKSNQSRLTLPRARSLWLPIYAGLALVLSPSSALAQAQLFDALSDGSFGAINITANTTLALPVDGIFHATTITVAAGTVLNFSRNARNTPVQLRATGDVLIQGSIRVNGGIGTSVIGGAGGVGGYPGGFPGGVLPAGAGQGPGGGLPGTNGNSLTTGTAGNGAYGSGSTNAPISDLDGVVYGSPLLVPPLGGSGAGGTEDGHGGGGGGGAILIASDTQIVIETGGEILAKGGRGSGISNHGSGGGVRLVAPLVAGQGNAEIDVSGGISTSTTNYGGAGRIRIDTFDKTQLGPLTFLPTNTSIGTIGTFMLVEPSPLPRLDILAAAGRVIDIDSGPVQVVLPTGTSTSQTVTVQATDFTGIVLIEVVVLPENGLPVTVTANIDMAGGNPSQVVVPVEIPLNTTAFIHAWRR